MAKNVHFWTENLLIMVKNRKPKIVSYQLIKSNCQFDNIVNALSDIIIDNIIRVRALDRRFYDKKLTISDTARVFFPKVIIPS